MHCPPTVHRLDAVSPHERLQTPRASGDTEAGTSAPSGVSESLLLLHCPHNDIAAQLEGFQICPPTTGKDYEVGVQATMT